MKIKTIINFYYSNYVVFNSLPNCLKSTNTQRDVCFPYIISLLICLTIPANSFADIKFEPSSQWLGDSSNYSVALGDLDGDGDLDAFVTSTNINESNSTPPYFGAPDTVWFNNGEGVFSDSGQRLSVSEVGDYSLEVTLGDLDNDGDLDAVVGSTTIWINDGCGYFTKADQDLGWAYIFALGDIDLDGDIDALSGYSLWLNDGRGNFVERLDLLPEPRVINSVPMIKLDDLDNDGDLDAVFSLGSGSNHVWRNERGRFVDTMQSLGRTAAEDIAIGDVDGDGDKDIVFSYGSLWLNDGDGLYSSAGSSPEPTGWTSVELLDIDGDDDLDAVFAGSPNSVWENLGSGEFVLSDQPLMIDYFTQDITTGDLNGDGSQDLFIVKGGSPSNLGGSDIYTFRGSSVWLNDDSGLFRNNGQTITAYNNAAVDLGDVDGDGDLDAVVAKGFYENRYLERNMNELLLNDGNGNLQPNGQSIGDAALDIKFADLDSDNDLDIIVVNGTANDAIWMNDGQGNYTSTNQQLFGFAVHKVAVADLDQDNDLDIVSIVSGNIASPVIQENKIWINNGNGQFSDSGQTIGDYADGVALSDIDGDGDIDAVFTSFYERDALDVLGDQQLVSIWKNDGEGVLLKDSETLALILARTDLQIADLDGDQDVDIYLSRDWQPDLVLLNDGTGTFTDSGQSLSSSSSLVVSSAGQLNDFDQDGDLDIMVVTYHEYDPSYIPIPDMVWINNGTGIFEEYVETSVETFASGVAIGDLDGDGDIDAFISDFEKENVVLLNISNETNVEEPRICQATSNTPGISNNGNGGGGVSIFLIIIALIGLLYSSALRYKATKY